MTSTSREALVVFAENVENVNKAVDNMNQSLARHTDLLNASDEMKVKLEELSSAINSNDKKLMLNLSKEITNLSSGLSKSIKNEADKLNKSIQESGVVTSASVNKEIGKLLKDNKKNQNVKLLKELSNSTSSLNAALEAISSQNKQLVKEITDQKESITFP
jgi:methyl-accepting chemotaxis protein